MERWPKLTKDQWGALLMVVLGIAVAVQGYSYRVGALRSMGPGYIPLVLGIILICVGAGIGLTPKAPAPGLGAAPSIPKEPLHLEWRGWLCICAGVFSFVVIGTYGGLVPASLASVFISAMGDRQNTVGRSLLLAIGLTLFGVVVFHYGLQLQLPLFSWG